MSFGLVFIKLVAYAFTGSVLVLASLLDSAADVCSSLINMYINKKSLEEADKEHPFGHGGFEVVGSLIQGMVITFFTASLFIESVRKWVDGDKTYIDYSSLPFAVGVLSFSALGGYLIHLFLKVQIRKMEEKKERSLSLIADHAHYSGDAYANAASAIGVFLVYLTNYWALDAVLGCVAAAFLAWAAYPILYKAFRDIVHNEAPEKLQQDVVDIVMSVDHRIKGLHMLRSRQFGPYLFVDFHMKVSDGLTIKEAHAIGDRVMQAIKKTIPRSDVLIHLDPESEPDQRYWDPSYTLPPQ